MLHLIGRAVAPWLLVASCGSTQPHDLSIAAHERSARHYDAIATSIEAECAKARRNELTVGDLTQCWKAQDKRFLDANRDAATKHRIAATRLRATAASASASR